MDSILEFKVNEEETIRQFIRNSEKYFDIKERDLMTMTVLELDEYIDYLSYLWEK